MSWSVDCVLAKAAWNVFRFAEPTIYMISPTEADEDDGKAGFLVRAWEGISPLVDCDRLK